MKNKLIKLTENDVHNIVKESVKKIIKESPNDWRHQPRRGAKSGTLNDAIELLVDAYENIDEATRNNKELRFDIVGSLNGIRNAVRIIRRRATEEEEDYEDRVPHQM